MTEHIEQGEGYTLSYEGDKLTDLDYDEAEYRVTLIPVSLVQAFERLPNCKSWMDLHEFVRQAVRRFLELQEQLSS